MAELSDEELIERLSTPALAIYSELRHSGEIYSREDFLKKWPDVDYSAVIQELINEGIIPEPSIPAETPRGVLFKNRSPYSLRVD
ncbi:hypothetical protein [Streptomyces prunicolor]|uniref:hypothetical protein n=1 Tax=Streptomyces prunicolor TaxID=67348 RepID=UPI0033C85D78